MVDYPTGEMLASSFPNIRTAELIQTGGQKAVYKVSIEEQFAALKLIALAPEEPTTDEDSADVSMTLRRAEREVAILEQADIPVLAKRGPLGLSSIEIMDERWLYFTEEWIEGIDLHNLLRQGRLSSDKVARLGVDLVQAVCWLSSRGLIHRDIKPENIMWSPDRMRFVLLDPGVAFDLHGPSLTMLPMPVGTMAYLSPEQMDPTQKRNMDFRSDLFAIGLVLYEAATGEHPFVAPYSTPAQVVAGILTAHPQPIDNKLQGFPTNLSELITRLLGKAPHLRYRTCDRARTAMDSVALSLGVQP